MNRNVVIFLLGIAVVIAGLLAIGLTRSDGEANGPLSLTTTAPTTEPATTSLAGVTASPSSTTGTRGTVPYTPIFEEGRCRFDVPEARTPRCGWLTVPENRSVATGRDVRIHVAIFSSDATDPRPDPLVYLDGGPGGETLDALMFSFEDVWAPLLTDRDLVFFDQRGVGHSDPSLACPEELELGLELLGQDLSADEALSRELAAIGECRDRLIAQGVDLSAYDSAANAADVADLRIALGYDDWNLLGISYGTRLAQTIMRDHPEGVRSVILDSTLATAANLITESPANLDRAFDTLFAACKSDPACNETYPDLRARTFSLADRLESAPLEFTARDFLTGEQYEAIIDGPGLLGTIFQGLYSEEIFPQLPKMVAELERGDTSIVSLLTSNDIVNARFFSLGMHLSVQCREEIAFTAVADIAAGLEPYPELNDLFAESLNLSTPVFSVCELWQSGSADPIEELPVESSIPTLVMAGSFDPITPPAWGRLAAASLDHSFFVEFPTLGHGVSIGGECPSSIALAFMREPSVEPATSCITDMEPVLFVPAPFDPSALRLVPFEEDVFGVTISGVVPEGWDSAGPGTRIRGTNGLDQTAIVQQVTPGGAGEGFVLAAYEDQLGITGGLNLSRVIRAGEFEWRVFTGSIDGFQIDVALGDGGDLLGLVLMVSDPVERADLLSVVFDPVLEAFRTS